MELTNELKRGNYIMCKRFEPRKRTAIDGCVWWCVFDTERNNWSTFLCHGKYKTKKACEQAIAFCGI